MPKSIDYARRVAAEMLDDELFAIVGKLKDGDGLTLLQSAVIDEIARRQLPVVMRPAKTSVRPGKPPRPSDEV